MDERPYARANLGLSWLLAVFAVAMIVLSVLSILHTAGVY